MRERERESTENGAYEFWADSERRWTPLTWQRNWTGRRKSDGEGKWALAGDAEDLRGFSCAHKAHLITDSDLNQIVPLLTNFLLSTEFEFLLLVWIWIFITCLRRQGPRSPQLNHTVQVHTLYVFLVTGSEFISLWNSLHHCKIHLPQIQPNHIGQLHTISYVNNFQMQNLFDLSLKLTRTSNWRSWIELSKI